MLENKLGEDSPISKFIQLKIRRRYRVESLATLEEDEFKVPIEDYISVTVNFKGIWELKTIIDWYSSIPLIIYHSQKQLKFEMPKSTKPNKI